jgi:hypothetical protein
VVDKVLVFGVPNEPLMVSRYPWTDFGYVWLAALIFQQSLEVRAKIETSHYLVPTEKKYTNVLSKIRDETVLCLMFCNVCVY